MSSQKLSIATWNVERPTFRSKKVPAINDELKKQAADIFILTETHHCISPGKGYSVSSSMPLKREQDGSIYEEGELRVSIYSVFPIIKQLEVTNPCTTVCSLIKTPYGQLAVYGCIIGIHGRGKGFDIDLEQQIQDLSRLTKQYPVCYAGDYNLSFCDNYYTKETSRSMLEESFSRFGIKNLTAEIPANIDHVAISESFLANTTVQYNCWNVDKKLSDHKGVAVSFSPNIIKSVISDRMN